MKVEYGEKNVYVLLGGEEVITYLLPLLLSPAIPSGVREVGEGREGQGGASFHIETSGCNTTIWASLVSDTDNCRT